MKCEKRHLTPGRVVFITITVLLLFSLLPSLTAIAAYEFDYSRPGFVGADYNEEIDSAEFLEDVLGLSLTSEERDYLSEYGDFVLTYPKNIPASYVSLSANDSSVRVSAKPYTYTAKDGKEIVCIPSSARVAGDSMAYDFPNSADADGNYVLTLSADTKDEDMKVELSYSVELEFAPEAVNSLISKAWRDAEYFVYLDELLSYEAELAKYNAYLKDKKIYDEELIKYNNYLAELEEYNTVSALYREYLLELEKYNADYLLYLESEKRAENLADEIAAYNEYLAMMEKVDYRLYIMEETKSQKTDLKRSLYDAIYGTAVDQVLENQTVLVTLLGVKEQTVVAAGDATKTLRSQLKGFFSCKTEEEKYTYYKGRYRYLAPNFATLFAALDELYTNDAVRNTLAENGKGEKYDIFLAQLYFAAHAFTDGPVYKLDGVTPYTEDYKIKTANGYKTPADIIGDTEYYGRDGVAQPAKNDVYPDRVEKPDYTPVPKPQKPDEVREPTAPKPVSEPMPPEAVNEPQAPAQVPDTGVGIKPPFSEGSTPMMLLEAYRGGKLSDRKELMRDTVLPVSFDITLTKALFASTVTVTYHGEDGEPLGDIILDVGSFADIPYTPRKAETEKYTYVFRAWVDENGNSVNLGSVSQDLLIYPFFEPILKEFDITWLVDGVPTVTRVPYGSVPEFPGIPLKEGNISYYYIFNSWDSEPAPAYSDASYTARFDEHRTVPELDRDDAVTLEGDRVIVNAADVSRLEISHLLEASREKYSAEFVFDDCVLSLSYSELMKLSDDGACSLELSLSDDGREIAVLLYGENGEKISTDADFAVELECDGLPPATRVFTYIGGEKNYIRYTYSEGKLAFLLNTGHDYMLVPEYSVTLFAQDGIELSVNKALALEGDSIEISYKLPEGSRMISLYYIGDDGVKRSISESFSMPPCDIQIGADFERIQYTVSFVADGTVIASSKYFFGDSVRVPAAPDGFSDDKYTYTFVSWSPEISPVTGDATYTAVYRTDKTESDGGGIKISEGVWRIIRKAAFVALCAVAAAGSFAAAVTVFVLKRKKRKK